MFERAPSEEDRPVFWVEFEKERVEYPAVLGAAGRAEVCGSGVVGCDENGIPGRDERLVEVGFARVFDVVWCYETELWAWKRILLA